MPPTGDSSLWPPAAPAEPQFDAERRTWTLSRYRDVEAALRHPALRQASVEGKDVDVADDPGHEKLLRELRADTERLLTAPWRARMAGLASTLMNRAAGPAPADLVGAIIKPWSTILGIEFSGADLSTQTKLAEVARIFALAHENPGCPLARASLSRVLAKTWRSWRQRRAQRQLGCLIAARRIQIGRAFYASTTQTLPSLLAKAWLALLLHPDQMDKLRAEPERMPAAVEELLRYAGLVRLLLRRATAEVRIGDVRIGAGDLVALRPESANRDPQVFPTPDRLDITRGRTGNLGLGVGAHACPGAAMVRLSLALTTPAFLAARPRLDPEGAVIWKGDATVTWPAAIPVFLEKQPVEGPL